eukprot:gene628-347_t
MQVFARFIRPPASARDDELVAIRVREKPSITRRTPSPSPSPRGGPPLPPSLSSSPAMRHVDLVDAAMWRAAAFECHDIFYDGAGTDPAVIARNTQEDVYQVTCAPYLQQHPAGCGRAPPLVFMCYGTTGTGKTYTIFGGEATPEEEEEEEGGIFSRRPMPLAPHRHWRSGTISCWTAVAAGGMAQRFLLHLFDPPAGGAGRPRCVVLTCAEHGLDGIVDLVSLALQEETKRAVGPSRHAAALAEEAELRVVGQRVLRLMEQAFLRHDAWVHGGHSVGMLQRLQETLADGEGSAGDQAKQEQLLQCLGYYQPAYYKPTMASPLLWQRIKGLAFTSAASCWCVLQYITVAYRLSRATPANPSGSSRTHLLVRLQELCVPDKSARSSTGTPASLEPGRDALFVDLAGSERRHAPATTQPGLRSSSVQPPQRGRSSQFAGPKTLEEVEEGEMETTRSLNTSAGGTPHRRARTAYRQREERRQPGAAAISTGGRALSGTRRVSPQSLHRPPHGSSSSSSSSPAGIRETQHINTSLLVLRRVVQTWARLCRQQQRHQILLDAGEAAAPLRPFFVPFKESPLTAVLEPFFLSTTGGGRSSHVALVICCAATTKDFAETVISLQLGTQASAISLPTPAPAAAVTATPPTRGPQRSGSRTERQSPATPPRAPLVPLHQTPPLPPAAAAAAAAAVALSPKARSPTPSPIPSHPPGPAGPTVVTMSPVASQDPPSPPTAARSSSEGADDGLPPPPSSDPAAAARHYQQLAQVLFQHCRRITQQYRESVDDLAQTTALLAAKAAENEALKELLSQRQRDRNDYKRIETLESKEESEVKMDRRCPALFAVAAPSAARLSCSDTYARTVRKRNNSERRDERCRPSPLLYRLLRSDLLTMTLVLEARRLPFESVSAAAAAEGAAQSGWSPAALEALTTWDKAMLPAVIPLARQCLAGSRRPAHHGSNSSSSAAAEAAEVKFVRRVLADLGDLEAAYYQMRDERRHLKLLAEDRERAGAGESGDGGEYSWWPTGDEDRLDGREREMALLQHHTGFSAEEEQFYMDLLQGHLGPGGASLPLEKPRQVGEEADQPPEPEDVAALARRCGAAPGMDPTIDITMAFDMHSGESFGMGSADLFGGHGVHPEDEGEGEGEGEGERREEESVCPAWILLTNSINQINNNKKQNRSLWAPKESSVLNVLRLHTAPQLRRYKRSELLSRNPCESRTCEGPTLNRIASQQQERREVGNNNNNNININNNKEEQGRTFWSISFGLAHSSQGVLELREQQQQQCHTLLLTALHLTYWEQQAPKAFVFFHLVRILSYSSTHGRKEVKREGINSEAIHTQEREGGAHGQPSSHYSIGFGPSIQNVSPAHSPQRRIVGVLLGFWDPTQWLTQRPQRCTAVRRNQMSRGVEAAPEEESTASARLHTPPPSTIGDDRSSRAGPPFTPPPNRSDVLLRDAMDVHDYCMLQEVISELDNPYRRREGGDGRAVRTRSTAVTGRLQQLIARAPEETDADLAERRRPAEDRFPVQSVGRLRLPRGWTSRDGSREEEEEDEPEGRSAAAPPVDDKEEEEEGVRSPETQAEALPAPAPIASFFSPLQGCSGERSSLFLGSPSASASTGPQTVTPNHTAKSAEGEETGRRAPATAWASEDQRHRLLPQIASSPSLPLAAAAAAAAGERGRQQLRAASAQATLRTQRFKTSRTVGETPPPRRPLRQEQEQLPSSASAGSAAPAAKPKRFSLKSLRDNAPAPAPAPAPSGPAAAAPRFSLAALRSAKAAPAEQRQGPAQTPPPAPGTVAATLSSSSASGPLPSYSELGGAFTPTPALGPHGSAPTRPAHHSHHGATYVHRRNKIPIPRLPPAIDFGRFLQHLFMEDVYDTGAKISEGTYGEVYVGTHRKSGAVVALKRLKQLRGLDGFPLTSLREVTALQHIQAQRAKILVARGYAPDAEVDEAEDPLPNVIRLREVLLSSGADHDIYLVFDYAAHSVAGLLSSGRFAFRPGPMAYVLRRIFLGYPPFVGNQHSAEKNRAAGPNAGRGVDTEMTQLHNVCNILGPLDVEEVCRREGRNVVALRLLQDEFLRSRQSRSGTGTVFQLPALFEGSATYRQFRGFRNWFLHAVEDRRQRYAREALSRPDVVIPPQPSPACVDVLESIFTVSDRQRPSAARLLEMPLFQYVDTLHPSASPTRSGGRAWPALTPEAVLSEEKNLRRELGRELQLVGDSSHLLLGSHRRND